MTISHTHVIVQDCPPPDETMVVGSLYGIAPVFKTFVPDYAPNFVADEEEDDEAEEVKAKVVKPRGRRPQPKANAQAETK